MGKVKVKGCSAEYPLEYRELGFCKESEQLLIGGPNGTNIPVGGNGSGGVDFTTDETLTLENGVLSVNTADVVEADNTRPITSAAVHAEIGNIDALLQTI